MRPEVAPGPPPGARGARCDRVVLVVLDSVGCGAAPDAAAFGDEGADTLGHLSQAVGGVTLPHLQGLGLGNLTPIIGVPPVAASDGAHGWMRERSAGKDTTTGHWEMAGLLLDQPFRTFPHGFPAEVIDRLCQAIGRQVLGNKVASGTTILDELGEEHLRTGRPIVYTSADSVFQVAAHESVIPVDELYRICRKARRLCDELGVARVIARPFVGPPGAFRRTYHRRDFSTPPPAPTVLEALVGAGVPVVGVGKIGDIFAGRGLTEDLHSAGNADGMRRAIERLASLPRGLLFVNLVDFDMLYGHRRDPQGYAAALVELDGLLPLLRRALGPRDLAILTADHGNDPTFPGTDHTRELVPLLCLAGAGPRHAVAELGVRDGFYDVAQTLCQAFGLPAWERGQGFLDQALP